MSGRLKDFFKVLDLTKESTGGVDSRRQRAKKVDLNNAENFSIKQLWERRFTGYNELDQLCKIIEEAGWKGSTIKCSGFDILLPLAIFGRKIKENGTLGSFPQ